MIKAKHGQAQNWIEDSLSFDGSDCLMWPFKSRSYNGYPVVAPGRLVSTIICERTHGPRPSIGHHAAHSCGNGHLGCLNPKHIRWKTVSENALERRPTHVLMMSSEKREAIVMDFINGMLPKDVVHKHGITLSYAYRIKERKMMKRVWAKLGPIDCFQNA